MTIINTFCQREQKELQRRGALHAQVNTEMTEVNAHHTFMGFGGGGGVRGVRSQMSKHTSNLEISHGWR